MQISSRNIAVKIQWALGESNKDALILFYDSTRLGSAWHLGVIHSEILNTRFVFKNWIGTYFPLELTSLNLSVILRIV